MHIFTHAKRKFLLAVFKLRRSVNRWLGTRRLDYPKHKLLIFTDTIREYETRARSIKKEPKTVAWIEKGSDGGGVLYDVGANVGAYTLVAATNGFRVIAFEPSYQNVYKIHKNVFLNALTSFVTVVPIVLSNKEGISRFIQKDESFGASDSFSGENISNSGHAFLMMSLDECMKLFSLPAPSLVKIDVDGAELEVLDGAKQLLENRTLKSILVEVDKENISQVKKIMAGAGLHLTDEEKMDEDTVNYIFTRP